MNRQEKLDSVRRNSLAGLIALRYMIANPDSDFAKIFVNMLGERIKDPDDRKLFALPPRAFR
jgi:hypothetical protein